MALWTSTYGTEEWCCKRRDRDHCEFLGQGFGNFVGFHWIFYGDECLERLYLESKKRQGRPIYDPRLRMTDGALLDSVSHSQSYLRRKFMSKVRRGEEDYHQLVNVMTELEQRGSWIQVET